MKNPRNNNKKINQKEQSYRLGHVLKSFRKLFFLIFFYRAAHSRDKNYQLYHRRNLCSKAPDRTPFASSLNQHSSVLRGTA